MYDVNEKKVTLGAIQASEDFKGNIIELSAQISR